MSVTSTPSQPSAAATPEAGPAALAPALIDSYCRLPLVVLFLSAGIWLLIASAFGLIASIKFHAPGFLADHAWLTYGRVRPTGTDAMLYGFCVQAGLGVALWMLARLGRTLLAAPWMVLVGALCWNLGLAAGVTGILLGGGTGYDTLELPGYAASLLFFGYLMIVFWGVVTFHRRRERQLYVSQWFLLAALFWYPWIYSTANLLLLTFQVRGIAQAVIAWWYADNFLVVWLGLMGLAAIFYLVPKLTSRELHSRYLALFAFWMLILFGSWGGISASAPLPAWMPVSSMVATVLGVMWLIAVALNLHQTLEGNWSELLGHTSLQFVGFGIIAFLVAGLARAVTAFPAVNQVTQFTWFTVANGLLQSYGFFAMVIFGAIYYIAPRLTGHEFPFPKLVRVHFWTAAAGVLLFVVPLAAGGVLQGLKLQHANIAFADIVKGTLPFLRASTMGDLLLALGHVLFLLNLAGLGLSFYRERAASAWADATAEVTAAEPKA